MTRASKIKSSDEKVNTKNEEECPKPRTRIANAILCCIEDERARQPNRGKDNSTTECHPLCG
jgi:hypothetical protein